MAALNSNWYNYQLENNVHQALERLYVKMVPKELYSDLTGGQEHDIDTHGISGLLNHLGKK